MVHCILGVIADLKDLTREEVEGMLGQAGSKRDRAAALRAAVLARLPAVLPCTRNVVGCEVSQKDSREPLRGEQGVKAGCKGVPAGAFIGEESAMYR
jgi:hypothetical protein